ncbi:MAG: DUF4417 domain-containing protein [Selenomonadaceae bacterium]|nr:DUF4417 domain-containing protein [Selenomonadaceae bacterium]
MRNELSIEERLKISRPVIGEHNRDRFGVPVIKRVTEDMIDFRSIRPLNIQNLSRKNNNTDKLVLPFAYDERLARFWNEPLKYIPLFQSSYAVATLDFSIRENMAFPEYLHNIYKNRWLGCLWQDYGITTIPTVGWTTEEWDDLSFSGVERESVIVISTLGCKRNPEYFMRGYNEMIYRLAPSLIIVYGDMHSEMTGRFINFKYKESFQPKIANCSQTVLFDVAPIFEVRR